ncbi:MAG: hypothetical protein R3A11_03315 [Bdellovibrionota bacterium]
MQRIETKIQNYIEIRGLGTASGSTNSPWIDPVLLVDQLHLQSVRTGPFGGTATTTLTQPHPIVTPTLQPQPASAAAVVSNVVDPAGWSSIKPIPYPIDLDSKGLENMHVGEQTNIYVSDIDPDELERIFKELTKERTESSSFQSNRDQRRKIIDTILEKVKKQESLTKEEEDFLAENLIICSNEKLYFENELCAMILLIVQYIYFFPPDEGYFEFLFKISSYLLLYSSERIETLWTLRELDHQRNTGEEEQESLFFNLFSLLDFEQEHPTVFSNQFGEFELDLFENDIKNAVTLFPILSTLRQSDFEHSIFDLFSGHELPDWHTDYPLYDEDNGMYFSPFLYWSLALVHPNGRETRFDQNQNPIVSDHELDQMNLFFTIQIAGHWVDDLGNTIYSNEQLALSASRLEKIVGSMRNANTYSYSKHIEKYILEFHPLSIERHRIATIIRRILKNYDVETIDEYFETYIGYDPYLERLKDKIIEEIKHDPVFSFLHYFENLPDIVGRPSYRFRTSHSENSFEVYSDMLEGFGDVPILLDVYINQRRNPLRHP